MLKTLFTCFLSQVNELHLNKDQMTKDCLPKAHHPQICPGVFSAKLNLDLSALMCFVLMKPGMKYSTGSNLIQ